MRPRTATDEPLSMDMKVLHQGIQVMTCVSNCENKKSCKVHREGQHS